MDHITASPQAPTPRPRTTVCPYCGHVGVSSTACERCRGLFEPLSRQASQNSMGPWFIRDESNPFLPGCSLATMRLLIRRNKVTAQTILRGPATRQFWTFARNVPGIANLLGECHACHAAVLPGSTDCPSCGAAFAILEDRERLGLSDVRLLPGHAAPEQIAAAEAFPSPSIARPSNGSASTTRPISHIGVDVPDEARAFIVARQRHRRGKRRFTVTVVLLILAVAGTGAAVALVLAKRDRDARASRVPPSSRQATPVVQPPASQTPQTPTSPSLPREQSLGPVPLAPPVPFGSGSEATRLVADLASTDDRVVQQALSSLSAEQRAAPGLVFGAARAAERRLAAHKLAQRL